MEYKDYYKVLGVAKQATAQEIKSAYRGLARKFHPDLHPGDKKAEERFKAINEAYEVLGDAEKRKKYDDLGANWEEILRNKESARQYAAPGAEWSGGESFDLNDFFETFFGGAGQRRGRTRGWGGFGGHEEAAESVRHGEAMSHPVELTLEEAFHGTSRRLQLSLDQPCGRCHGTGVITEHGRRTGKRQAEAHSQTMSMVTCPECGGRRVVSAQKSLDVKIPKGVTEGSRVRLAGMGGQAGPGGRPGDLYLEVHLRPHRWFQVDGHDLVCELPVRDDEAVLGATVHVPTLEGRVSLKIPPGSQQGGRLRLKGKGLPHLHGSAPGASGGSRGDLYYTLKIVVPSSPSEEERALIHQLSRLRQEQGDRADPRRVFFS